MGANVLKTQQSNLIQFCMAIFAVGKVACRAGVFGSKGFKDKMFRTQIQHKYFSFSAICTCSTVTSEDVCYVIRNVKFNCVIVCLSPQFVYCFWIQVREASRLARVAVFFSPYPLPYYKCKLIVLSPGTVFHCPQLLITVNIRDGSGIIQFDLHQIRFSASYEAGIEQNVWTIWASPPKAQGISFPNLPEQCVGF